MQETEDINNVLLIAQLNLKHWNKFSVVCWLGILEFERNALVPVLGNLWLKPVANVTSLKTCAKFSLLATLNCMCMEEFQQVPEQEAPTLILHTWRQESVQRGKIHNNRRLLSFRCLPSPPPSPYPTPSRVMKRKDLDSEIYRLTYPCPVCDQPQIPGRDYLTTRFGKRIESCHPS